MNSPGNCNIVPAPSDWFACDQEGRTKSHAPVIEIDHICLDCGRKIDNALMDRCGKDAKCELRAAVNFYARKWIPTPDTDAEPLSADGLFEKYQDHSDCFVVGQIEHNGANSMTKKQPSMKHVMRLIADGSIEDATDIERTTANTWLQEFNGI